MIDFIDFIDRLYEFLNNKNEFSLYFKHDTQEQVQHYLFIRSMPCIIHLQTYESMLGLTKLPVTYSSLYDLLKFCKINVDNFLKTHSYYHSKTQIVGFKIDDVVRYLPSSVYVGSLSKSRLAFSIVNNKKLRSLFKIPDMFDFDDIIFVKTDEFYFAYSHDSVDRILTEIME